MKTVIARILLVVACFASAFTVGTLASQPAAATVASSHTSLWWDSTTCHAFASGRFHLMVVASRHADTYLRVDVALWAHDAKKHAPAQTLRLDRGYVALDCTTTGDTE
jgi:hypothetical protein